MQIELKGIMDGACYKHQVQLRTDHPCSSYGQPVMEFTDGKLCGADCWILGCGRVIKATEKEKALFKKWINNINAMIGGS